MSANRSEKQKPRTSAKKPRGSSRAGEGGPKRGSHLASVTSDALASTASGPPSSTPPSSPAASGPSPLLPPPVESDELCVADFPRRVSDLNRFRAPPMKGVGLDKDGKVIPHHRSEEIAQIVLYYVGMGASENFICAHLNIRPGLLRQHYSNELTHGAERANVEVAGAAFRMATNEEDAAMTKFWLKAKAKWRDGDNSDDKNNSLFNINIHI